MWKERSGALHYPNSAAAGGARSKARPSTTAATPPEPVDLVAMEPDSAAIRDIRGGEITMIFQEPMVSFSPVHTVGSQIEEGVKLHTDVTKEGARDIAIDSLRRVGIANPELRIDEYPFRLSGGMRQRAMIAMALASNPTMLIADEPTTAVDVTTQAQILELMEGLQEEYGMAMMLISHNLGVVAQMADEIIVMYLGKIVEHADVKTLFSDPKHPYTQELLKSIPRLQRQKQTERLVSIVGNVPHPYNRPSGCPFNPRCPHFMQGVCDRSEPELTSVAEGHMASCFLYSEPTDGGEKD